MKKFYIIIVVIIIIMFGYMVLNNLFKQSKLIEVDGKLIKDEVSFGDIKFGETIVTVVDGKTLITVVIKNFGKDSFHTNEIIFKLIDSNKKVIASSSKEDVFITANSERLYNVSFDKIYKNIYDIEYVIK